MKKPTIMDIARKTGLSKGTVDRVLHRRGEVSKKSFEKVMAAVMELGYEPDLNASILARKENLNIALIVPASESGSFWELALSSLGRLREKFLPLRISIEHFSYDQYSEASFIETCSRLLAAAPEGVIIAPIFREATIEFTERLRSDNIPYCFIDSKLEIEGYFAYFGMPLYKSGYLCADQLTLGNSPGHVLIVRVHRDKERQSDPTVNRRAGFMDYMLHFCPETRIHMRFIDSSDADATMATLEAFRDEYPGVKHIVMFNSRVNLLVPYLSKYPDPERRVVGFDNLPSNIAALRHGEVTVLIGQRPDVQIELAVQALSDYFLLGRTPSRRDNFMHMDILTRFNIEDY